MAVCSSAGVYLILWSTLIFPIHTMTPVWVFPGYPLLITAPFAGNLVNAAVKVGRVGQINGLPIAMAAVAVQGMGFSLSFMVLAAFVYRLMTQKLPRDTQRPGVFISVGPSAFTAAGLGGLPAPRLLRLVILSSVKLLICALPIFAVQLGGHAADFLPADFLMPGMTEHAVFVLRLLSSMIGLWLWGLALWYVCRMQ